MYHYGRRTFRLQATDKTLHKAHSYRPPAKLYTRPIVAAYRPPAKLYTRPIVAAYRPLKTTHGP